MSDDPFDAPYEADVPEEPVADPATQVLAWLRGEFDKVNTGIRDLSDRLTRHEAAVLGAVGNQEAELDTSLAILEGAATSLRGEAANLQAVRDDLTASLPGLVADAVRPVLTASLDAAVAELRTMVSQLGAALAEALPAAVADAVAPAMAPVPVPVATPPEPVRVASAPVAEEGEGADLVSQLHQAQDEAAEWFNIVVDEAVRQAVERWMAPLTPAAPAAPATAPTNEAAAEPDVAAPAPVDAPQEPAVAPAALVPEAVPDPPEPVLDLSGTTAGPSGQADVAPAAPFPDPFWDAPEAETLTVAVGPPPQPGVTGGSPDDGSGIAGAAPILGEPVVMAAADPDAASPPPLVGTAPEPAAVAPMAATPPPAPPQEATAVPGEPAAAATGDEEEDPGERDPLVSCVLPGVAVGPTLALGVSAALRRSRLRRRRRRRAGAPSAGLFRHDPYAGELTRRLERFAIARRSLAWSPNGMAPVAPVVVAERDGQELAVDLGAGPLALVGPAAADAGRALVATFVATTEPSAGRVVVTGDLFPPGPSFPGFERASSLTVALDALETEVERRRSPAGEAVGAAPEGNGDEPPAGLPLVVLVASTVPADLAVRLAAVVARGRSVGVTALAVGDPIDGASVVEVHAWAGVRSVAPADRLGHLESARLYCLGSGAAAELVDLLASARTDDDPTAGAEPEDEPFPVLLGEEHVPIDVRVLGAYRIDVGGKEIRSGLRAKARELLAFYLLHPEGATLDATTEALWPEADPGRGSEWFWTALGNLRSLLRTATGTKALKIIERDGDRYRIEPVFDVDLWRLQASLPPPGASTSDPKWAADLQVAADLYTGDLLSGVDWAWADVPREDLRRRAVDVLVSLAATCVVAGDVRAALESLMKAVDVDPVAEQLYRRIMRLQAKQLHLEEVEDTYRRLKARLSEVDLEPTAESERLVAELCR